MRIILFLIFVITQVGISQTSLKTTIDFSVKDKPIGEALQQLAEEANINIAFSNNFFKGDQNITVEIKNQSLEEVLKAILKDANVGVKILGDQVVLFLENKNQSFTISGFVEDGASGERLVNATIFSIEHQKGIVTNEYGFFSLTLPSGETNLFTRYLGFKESIKKINLKENQQYTISLEANLTLPEIVVNPDYSNNLPAQRTANNAILIDKKIIESRPSFGGEEDLLRMAQLLPGIQSGVDGLGGLLVRGGESGHNLMLMDGVPVYIPYHLLGLYSVFNSSTVNTAQILKGSFSARYGGRLSSVSDVRIKEGNKKEWKAEGGLNLVNAKLLVEGPFQKGKGSVLLAGRFAPNGFLLNPEFKRIYFQVEQEEGELNSTFNDYNIKINYSLSKKDHLYLSLFAGEDAFFRQYFENIEDEEEFNSELDFNWDNSIGMLRWNHLYSDKLFSNTSITYSSFRFNNTNYEEIENESDDETIELAFLENRSDNNDLGLRIDFDYLPNPFQTIRFGGGISRKEFSISFTYFDELDEELEELDEIDLESVQGLRMEETFSPTEAYLYFEDQIKLGTKWEANAGIRATSFFSEGEQFLNLEPRLSIRYSPTSKWSIYSSGSRMIQYLHLLTNAALRLPNDLWIPSGSDLMPSEAWQGELGLEWKPLPKINMTIDGYYKKMDQLYAYPDDRSFLENADLTAPGEFLTTGSGLAYGAELFLTYVSEKNTAMLSYTVANSERKFEANNLGLSYPHEYDQRHQVKLFLNQKLSKKFQIGLNWIYLSANPQWGLANTNLTLDAESEAFYEPGQKNSIRSTAYHRLDLTVSFQHDGGSLSHSFKLGAYNVYNRRNIAYYGVDYDETPPSTSPVFAMPFMPAFNYSIKF